jgi:hypothetical protein
MRNKTGSVHAGFMFAALYLYASGAEGAHAKAELSGYDTSRRIYCRSRSPYVGGFSVPMNA